MKSYFHRALLITLILLIFLTVFFFVPEEKTLLQEELKLKQQEFEEDKLKVDNCNEKFPVEELQKVRVLCWIMTSPDSRVQKAVHIQNTWGKRCDKMLLMSSRTDNQTETVIALPVDEGRDNLWRKTRAAFQYVFENHFDDADWFLKADDDAYVVVDNLRYMLYSYSHTYPIYFGYRFSPFIKQGYMAGASYVLSKEALTRFMNETDTSPCNQDTDQAEDRQMGYCMESAKVVAGDSRDEYKSERFLPMDPEYFIEENGFGAAPWLPFFMYYDTHEGINTVSDIGIAFHYIQPSEMYLFEYLIYHLRSVEAQPKLLQLPKKLTFKEVLKNLKDSEKDKAFKWLFGENDLEIVSKTP